MRRILGLMAVIFLLATPSAAQDCFDYGSGDEPPVLGEFFVSTPTGMFAPAGDLLLAATFYPLDEEYLTLHVLDAVNPSNVTELGHVSGFAAGGMQSPSRIEVVGDKVYLHSINTFVGIDISDPTAPTLDFSVHFHNPAGLAVSDGILWVQNRVNGLEGFDLSDPTAPAQFVTVASVAGCYGVEILGDHAFVSSQETLPAGRVHVVDISDPATAHEVGGVDIPAYLETRPLAVGERLFYLDVFGHLRSVDVSDPAAPVLTAVDVLPRAGGQGLGYLTRAGDVLYAADGVGVRVFDISDPDAPVDQGSLDALGTTRYPVIYGDLLLAAAVDGYVTAGYPDCGSSTGVPPVAPTAARVAAYPNPFNPRTEIRVELPSAQRTVLSIHDAQGRRLRTLFAGELPAGASTFSWDGTNDAGHALSSGVYYLGLEGAGDVVSTQLVLLR